MDDPAKDAIRRASRGAVRQALSVSVAVGTYGVSFGALSVSAGLDLLQTMALSLLMFTGGSQFAFIGVLGAGGAGAAAIATAGLLGARNALYGIQMAPLLRVRGGRRAAAAHLTIDESTAVATAQREPAAVRVGFWWTGVGVFVLWNAFTFAGAVLGDALGDPRAWGLDAAAAAAFLGLLWPRLASRQAQLVAAAAVLVALVLTPLVPAGLPVLGAAVVAILVGWFGTPRETRPGAGTVPPGGPEDEAAPPVGPGDAAPPVGPEDGAGRAP